MIDHGRSRFDRDLDERISYSQKRSTERIVGQPVSYIALAIEKGMSQNVSRLFDWYQVIGHLQEIEGDQSPLQDNYTKAVREYKDKDFQNSVRNIGIASEVLITDLCKEHYDQDDIGELTGGQINQLSNSDDGIPSYIGKTIAPAYWLRNRASHHNQYQITEADTHYALLCFQIAVEKYVEDYLEMEVTW